MAFNQIQFQHGMSIPEFLQCFGTEAQCGSRRWMEPPAAGRGCSQAPRSASVQVGQHSARQLEDHAGRCFSLFEVQQVRKLLLGRLRLPVQPPIRPANAHSATHRRCLAMRADLGKARQSAG